MSFCAKSDREFNWNLVPAEIRFQMFRDSNLSGVGSEMARYGGKCV